MIVPYAYDPEIHQIVELDVTRFLRLETKRPDLVTYYHRLSETWVCALREGATMADIWLLGTGEGEGPWASRTCVLRIIRRLKDLIDAREAKRRLRANDREGLKQLQDRQERLFDGYRKVHRRLKNRYGPMAAERWAQQTSMMACAGE